MHDSSPVCLLTATIVLMTAPLSVPAAAQTTHRLTASPSTVAFGHYDPDKPAVLRIAEGDIVEV
ncbi:MAG: hypothetical protein HKN71_00400, partial [Gemmatimonadetes bacterium]|nr:hypothetical protein [Gemmatimonadota bacterium]